MNIKRTAAIAALACGLVAALTACAATPEGEISEIEGAINGAVLEVWSQTANDYVDIAVVADHDCELYDVYFECLNPGDVLGRNDVPRYSGDGFDEESVEDTE